MNEALAEGTYEMAAGANRMSTALGLQIAMEEIRSERRLEVTPDPAAAFVLLRTERRSSRRDNVESSQESCCLILCSSSLTEDLAMTRSNCAR